MAALEMLALDTSLSKVTVPQGVDTYTVPKAINFGELATFSAGLDIGGSNFTLSAAGAMAFGNSTSCTFSGTSTLNLSASNLVYDEGIV